MGASLIKAIPGVGTFVGIAAMSATSGASTYAVGQVAISQFESGGSLEDIDLDKAKAAYDEVFEEGKEVVEEMEKEKKAREAAEQPEVPDDVLQALEKLGELKEKGIITDAEFKAQKTKLLERL